MADFLSIFVTVIFIIVEMRRLRKLERGEITDLETAAQQFMDEANAILAAE